MDALRGKKIIIGISGSIAAYKMAFMTRLLVKAGAEVRVLMTPAATSFITPLTLSTLSRHEVLTDVASEEGWNDHVELGLWADAMLLAPATANTLARLANGICDTIVGAVYLSARCPVFFAPAMDLDMWTHPATQSNIQRLRNHGNHLIPVGEGELASGLHGAGRMAEPEDMLATLNSFFAARHTLKGQRILITAGPTHEPIDPVRFIGNRSSGKMGIALAQEAARRGAVVELILGPVRYSSDLSGINLHSVETAQEMFGVAQKLFPDCTGAILAAAVADYRPATVATQKIKKKAGDMRIDLVRNPDIAATLGQKKEAGQWLVGFALETNNAEANARDKMERKNLDAIVLNTLQDAGAGFQHDTNKVSILTQDNKVRHFELKKKTEVAIDILKVVQEWIAS